MSIYTVSRLSFSNVGLFKIWVVKTWCKHTVSFDLCNWALFFFVNWVSIKLWKICFPVSGWQRLQNVYNQKEAGQYPMTKCVSGLCTHYSVSESSLR